MYMDEEAEKHSLLRLTRRRPKLKRSSASFDHYSNVLDGLKYTVNLAEFVVLFLTNLK